METHAASEKYNLNYLDELHTSKIKGKNVALWRHHTVCLCMYLHLFLNFSTNY
jgi:hypothetical protein